MRFTIIVILSLGLFVSCKDKDQSTVSDEKVEVELSQDARQQNVISLMSKMITESDLGLVLNNGNKWVVNDSVLNNLLKIKQQVYVISGNMENYTLDSYHTMGSEFDAFLKNIPNTQDPKSNEELLKIIRATKGQTVYLYGSDLQQAQIAIINLSTIYDEIPKYFEAAK